MNRPWMISRRALLRGAGAAIALPFLEQMVLPKAAIAAPATAPHRALFFFVPCGMVMKSFTPSATGANYALTPLLQPLAAMKNDFSVISGLQNNVVYDPNGAHATGTGGSLTCAHPTKSLSNLNNGISADQVIANAYRGKTPFASLEVGTFDRDGTASNCDDGYSCGYTRNISWSTPTTPNSKEVNPQALFTRLFGTFVPPSTPAPSGTDKVALYRKSILDLAKADTADLQKKLGTGDKQKLDQYLTGLRELELRIQALSTPGSGAATQSCQKPGAPVVNDHQARTRAMIDLMVAAFACDLTRSTSFMLMNGGSEEALVYGFLGLSNSHHTYSHYNGQSDIDALVKINTWEVQQLAYLMQQLKAVSDVGGGTVLDNTLIYFASEISDGNEHNVDNLPVIIAGGGSGTVTQGRHISAKGAPVANALLSMIQYANPTVTSFGNSSGALSLK